MNGLGPDYPIIPLGLFLPFRADHVMGMLFACKWQAPEQVQKDRGGLSSPQALEPLAALHQLDTSISPREPAGSLEKDGQT